MKGSILFQLMTLTSLSWASVTCSMQALAGAARLSQIRMLRTGRQTALSMYNINVNIRQLQAGDAFRDCTDRQKSGDETISDHFGWRRCLKMSHM